MSPIAKALNILQAETDVQMGWLLPTLTLLISKLDRVRTTSRYCKPLVDALQAGLQKRFGNMLVEPEFIAAAILVPKFKTSWTLDENIIKLGKIILVVLLVSLVKDSKKLSKETQFKFYHDILSLFRFTLNESWKYCYFDIVIYQEKCVNTVKF